MSHHTQMQVKMKEPASIQSALVDIGIAEKAIEFHQNPVPVLNYYRKDEGRRGHIVVRKGADLSPGRHLSADMGFLCGDQPQACIDDMDTSKIDQGRLQGRYAYHATYGAARLKGYGVTEADQGEEIHLTITIP